MILFPRSIYHLAQWEDFDSFNEYIVSSEAW